MDVAPFIPRPTRGRIILKMEAAPTIHGIEIPDISKKFYGRVIAVGGAMQFDGVLHECEAQVGELVAFQGKGAQVLNYLGHEWIVADFGEIVAILPEPVS